jgi:cell division protein FtsW (lipid II flippase)
MTLSESKRRAAVAITSIGAGLVAAVAVSLAHYDSNTQRLAMLAWTVWPYPTLWLLATRSKKRSTSLFWSFYVVFSFLFALIYYVLPRFVRGPSSWLSIGLVLTPGYLLVIGIMAFVGFATVRWIVGVLRPQPATTDQRP